MTYGLTSSSSVLLPDPDGRSEPDAERLETGVATDGGIAQGLMRVILQRVEEEGGSRVRVW